MTAASTIYFVTTMLPRRGQTVHDTAFDRSHAIAHISPGPYEHGRGYYEPCFDGEALISIIEVRPNGTWSDVTQELCDEAQKRLDFKPRAA